MELQETKFSFVYSEIKQRIMNNHIPPGDYLPSSRMLCNQFNVSRYTINRVFDALKEEGLIEIKPRIAPIVLSRTVMPESKDILSDILRKRDDIVQIYQTYALLLPPLLVFASQNCNLEMLHHYKKTMKISRLGISAGGWRSTSIFIKEILEIGGNHLLSNLYSTFELYSNLSFFIEECPYFLEKFLQKPVSFTRVIVDILRGNDLSIKYIQLVNLFQRFSDSIADVLERLSNTTPQYQTQYDISFSWKPTRGKDYFYSRIINDLNQKIGNGEYPRGTYLPYEKQLANQYGVSVSTIRKALAELEQRGLIKTLNGKGTVVIEPDDSQVKQLLSNSRRTEEALQYLHALQLLVLIIHPAALMAAPKFTSSELDELIEKLILPNSICIIDIFEAILKHIELEPLRVILTETFHLTEWGHYISYYDNKKRVLKNLNKQIIVAVKYLHEGDMKSFANDITDSYRYALKHAKEYMKKKYSFYSASCIQIPEKYNE